MIKCKKLRSNQEKTEQNKKLGNDEYLVKKKKKQKPGAELWIHKTTKSKIQTMRVVVVEQNVNIINFEKVNQYNKNGNMLKTGKKLVFSPFTPGNKSVRLKIEILILKYHNCSKTNLLILFHINFPKLLKHVNWPLRK